MMWWQLEIKVSGEEAEAFVERLEDEGALSVTQLPLGDAPDGDDVFEPKPNEIKLWRDGRVQALFDGGLPRKALAARVARALHCSEARLSITALQDADWQNAWRQHVQPLNFADRLRVVPEDLAGTTPEPRVVLNPGWAFGTGAHPTTWLCLDWLAHADLNGALILDVGCGSGILAIAALKLGARHAIAIDHDEQALQSTRLNADENGVGAHLTVAKDLSSDVKASVVIANILAQTLCDLSEPLALSVAAGGALVLSGILERQVAEVTRCYAGFSWEARAREEWRLLAGRRLTSRRLEAL